MGKMTVFHGSYSRIKVPEIPRPKRTKDFGPGFYCTLIREQARRWARRFSPAIVNVYTVDMNVMQYLKIKDFGRMSEEWLDFIISCRSGKSHSYDVVIGEMADDQVYNFVSDVMEGFMTREQFWTLAKFTYPTHQIAFCNPKALKALAFVRSEEV